MAHLSGGCTRAHKSPNCLKYDVVTNRPHPHGTTQQIEKAALAFGDVFVCCHNVLVVCRPTNNNNNTQRGKKKSGAARGFLAAAAAFHGNSTSNGPTARHTVPYIIDSGAAAEATTSLLDVARATLSSAARSNAVKLGEREREKKKSRRQASNARRLFLVYIPHFDS